MSARSWATPVRRSHSAQHGGDDDYDEIDLNNFRRIISGRHIGNSNDVTGEDSKDDKEDRYVSLKEMIDEHGFSHESEPTLKTFINYQQEVNQNTEASDANASKEANGKKGFLHVGDTDPNKESPREEYIRYATPQDAYSDSPFRQEAFEEFKESLNALSLNVDDVRGIQKVSS